ncbi:uncharacterized protein LOC108913606 isoform X2 [Anoplophora glabripennis]|uniref:uncharacterized protein LOC108913606 isoform X2 n=1 Tax=Anoplophora glabripennis TaxID=217634 RepID=UPI000874D8EB|nr:uncharacterized protein LOC108913606 isoform X2 [Anoplophora glabripennis]
MDYETIQNSGGEHPPRKKAKNIAERDPAKRDLATLPADILLKIFRYLDLKSINNCAMLCSTLNNVSKDSSLYKKVMLKFLESFISKISSPREVYIEYKFYDQHAEVGDYHDFNKYIEIMLRKCGEHILSLKIESCRNEELLLNISECIHLKRLTLYRCKSSFKTLPSIGSLTNISFVSCHFPQKTVSELVKNNPNLKYISLSNNVNVNANEICEVMSKYNLLVKEIHFSERKRVKSKSLRTLARLTNLRKLELISGPGFDSDPEDALEQLAAGCPQLEKLVIYGWKEINDDNFIPALHMLTQLKVLDLRGTNITIKSCREAALSLPLLKTMDVIKCHRVNKAQLAQLQKDFMEIHIPLE